MNHALRITLGAIMVLLGVVTGRSAATDVLRYNIEPLGQYTYLPSPEGPGIPGCDPSDFECAFGIDGRFSVHYDRTVGTAQLINLDLLLLGNEEVQNNPPGFVPVTAGRVADWLAGRLFEQVPVAAPIDLYVDPSFPDLQLTNSLTGRISLTGGYDGRSFDGDGVQFNLTAVLVPEPGFLALIGGAPLFGFALRRHRAA